MKALWNHTIIAESDDTVVVENNYYFPMESVNTEYLQSSESSSHCPWKGDASYYSLNVDGEQIVDAAWCYAKPKEGAQEIKGRLAFWKGVVVTA